MWRAVGRDRWVLAAWIGLLTLLMLAPVLAPGYILRLDMVFVPQQTLLPWNLGIGSGLPRSVPEDAVVSLVAGPLPGQILQKTVLVASVALAGAGAARLAGGSLGRTLPAASLYLWSPYLADRLLIGHWGLLWAYALLPWTVLAARRARESGQWIPLVLLAGVGALVPTGGVLLAVCAVPLALLPGSALTAGRRALVAALVVLVNGTWWVPTLRSGAAAVSDPDGLSIFGARSEGPGGVVWTALGGGGVWNHQAILPARGQWLAVLAIGVVAALAIAGWWRWRQEDPITAVWLGAVGVAGLAWVIASGVADQTAWARWIVGEVPGGGLLRDGQKWSAAWVLVLAVAAPRGLELLRRRIPDRAAGVVLAAGLAVLPVAATPDLAWGGFGRLHPVSYPPDWERLRAELAADPAPGDVLSLPWTPFRSYAWNDERVVLDPLPRYLTRTVLWNDRLPVIRAGRVVEIAGDDPRAEELSQVVYSGRPIAGLLGRLGVRWIVRQTDQPLPGAVNLAGATQVWTGTDLELWRVPDPVTVRRPRDPLVVAVDLLVLGLLAGLSIARIVTRRQRKSTEVGNR